MRYTDYDSFARIYNRHWSGYSQRVLGTLEHLGLKPPPARVLDLCCGTGQLAAQLVARGYDVTGLDGSDEMICLARANAPGCTFVIDDARTFRLPPEFDAVVSVFDSLNHIMTLDELLDVFRNVHAALKIGGTFIFDINLHEGYVRRGAGNFGFAGDDHAFVGLYAYDPDARISLLNLAMFLLEDDCWQRRDLDLSQTCYTRDEIRGALATTGFANCALHDATDFEITPHPDDRLFVVGHKPV